VLRGWTTLFEFPIAHVWHLAFLSWSHRVHCREVGEPAEPLNYLRNYLGPLPGFLRSRTTSRTVVVVPVTPRRLVLVATLRSGFTRRTAAQKCRDDRKIQLRRKRCKKRTRTDFVAA
jgi:hypothetical protein